ncbi:hypothetical protein [Deinococcus marmoris]|uniref:Uncharacterized protein n=1 Tax=Deinococcus marmoris TaxID=249408 RepID=A0A1U7P0Q9_9DEIO|nr:hypothetical protein [Deinococcus marmoris]OLV18746.1 hypothetical protein BOO71_0004615 [Deinococcus marmoris]
MTSQPTPRWPSLLPLLRFWLGLNVVLLAFTLLSRAFTPGADSLSPGGVLLCLLLTALGFALGLMYTRYWPLPEASFQRLVRMALLAIPAMGLAMALGLLLRPDISALVLALAAFLGAQWRFGTAQPRTVQPGTVQPAAPKSTPARATPRPAVSRQVIRQAARSKR